MAKARTAAQKAASRRNLAAARRQRAKELKNPGGGLKPGSNWVWLGIRTTKSSSGFNKPEAVMRRPIGENVSLVKTFGRAKKSKSPEELRKAYLHFISFEAGKKMKR